MSHMKNQTTQKIKEMRETLGKMEQMSHMLDSGKIEMPGIGQVGMEGNQKINMQQVFQNLAATVKQQAVEL